MKYLNAIFIIAFIFGLVGCGPNIARMNASLENGHHFAVAGGYERGFSSGGNISMSSGLNTGHPVVQLGYELVPDGDPEKETSMGVKLDYPFFLSTSMDIYRKFSSSHPFYYGVGFEGGILSGIYAVGTLYLGENFFVSLTPRIILNFPGLYRWSGNDSNGFPFFFNPQLSLGLDRKSWSLAAFVSYNYIPGKGFDASRCLISFDDANGCKNDKNERFYNQQLMSGLLVNF